ncbi:hypothetical protein [Leptospira santarosai]|uniref:hypothetical protein n=1 Tax=Leptospira santarosai TaxID=28183 RepID=UPI001F213033
MIGVYFRHARGNPDTSYDEIWEIVSPFLLYIPSHSKFPHPKVLRHALRTNHQRSSSFTYSTHDG